jgi:hypothetical protein
VASGFEDADVHVKQRYSGEVGIRFTHHAPIGSDGSAEDTKLRHNYLWLGESNGYPSHCNFSALSNKSRMV